MKSESGLADCVVSLLTSQDDNFVCDIQNINFRRSRVMGILELLIQSLQLSVDLKLFQN